jgi:hypothetical protein
MYNNLYVNSQNNVGYFTTTDGISSNLPAMLFTLDPSTGHLLTSGGLIAAVDIDFQGSCDEGDAPYYDSLVQPQASADLQTYSLYETALTCRGSIGGALACDPVVDGCYTSTFFNRFGIGGVAAIGAAVDYQTLTSSSSGFPAATLNLVSKENCPGN